MSADTSTYQPAAIPDEGTATQVYRIVIKATPQEIWDAITLPEFTRRYFHGAAITITPDGYASFGPDGSSWGDAEVLRVGPAEPGRPRLDVALRPDAGGRGREPGDLGDHARRRRHLPAHGRSTTGSRAPRGTASGVAGAGWMGVLSALKTPSGDGGAAAPDVRRGSRPDRRGDVGQVVHALVRRLPDQPPHGALLLRPADHHAVPPVVGDRPDLVREPLRGGRQLRRGGPPGESRRSRTARPASPHTSGRASVGLQPHRDAPAPQR